MSDRLPKILCEPICLTCIHGKNVHKVTGSRYELDCENNPNLGGVTKTFSRCRGYRKK